MGHVGDQTDRMQRHEFLAELHRLIEPRSYLEVGVYDGESLSLSRCPSIGVDPDFHITHELRADIHLARTTSDEFFARRHPLAHLDRPVLDLAFIDGMHLAEFALRDYLAIERFTEATSVVVLDDVLPRNIEEAARHRHTLEWTGDVYKVVHALRELRPDLVVLEVDTEPTGLAVVLLPDSSRSGVLQEYDRWLTEAVVPDPQSVPIEVLSRTRALDPHRLLQSAKWETLRRARGHPRPEVRAIAIREFAAMSIPNRPGR